MLSTAWPPADGKNRATGHERPLRIALPLAVVATATLALALACGGSGMGGMLDDGMGGMHGGDSQAAQTPVVSAASQMTVENRDFDFFPRELTVKTGTAVTWVNRDAAPHDATDEAGGWGTGTLNQGESATLTFDSPGAYRYFCTIHPNMRATLTVAERDKASRLAAAGHEVEAPHEMGHAEIGHTGL
jgi:plastocyanin